MLSFQASTWADIDSLRTQIMERPFDTIEDAAQAFATRLAESCPTAILARVFAVLPLAKLPLPERNFATALVGKDEALEARTPVLSLLGTAGRESPWCDRRQSVGHRAIPLLGATFVRNIPMIAKLLSDLDVSFSGLEDERVLDTRRLLGGNNAAFFVPDARSTQDSEGRHVIPSGDFVAAYGIRTVFGMGGAYVDGTLAVAIIFTSEVIDRLVVDRFPSLISNFKIATGELLARGRVFRNNDEVVDSSPAGERLSRV
jgi:two-component system NtrC family sensor kinase